MSDGTAGSEAKGRHGGRRAGAGRKPTGQARVAYSVEITPKQAELLKAWGGGDISAGLRWLVDTAAPLVRRLAKKGNAT